MSDTHNTTSSWAFLHRHAGLAIGVGLFVAVFMLVYSLAIHPTRYAADAMVLIKDSAVTEHYVVSEENTMALQTTSSTSANPVLNTMALLKSESISEALYDYLKTNHPKTLKKMKIDSRAQWQDFYGEGNGLIKAKNLPATDMITIQFKWDQPKIAQGGLAAILTAFQDTSRNINRAEQENRSRYLTERIGELETQVADVRHEKSSYKQQMQTASITKESEKLSEESILVTTKLNQTEARAQGKEAETLRFQKILQLSPETALSATALGLNNTLNQLNDKLYQLSQKQAELRTTLTEKNPKLQEVNAQIVQVKANITAEMTRTIANTGGKVPVAVGDTPRANIINKMVEARAEAIRLSTEANVLRSRLDQLDAQIQALPDKEQELARLEEKEKSLSSSLDMLRKKQLEAQLKQADTLSNVVIVDAPRVPARAAFPSKLHMIMIGLLLAFAAGVGAAWLKDRLLPGQLEQASWMPLTEPEILPVVHPQDVPAPLEDDMGSVPMTLTAPEVVMTEQPEALALETEDTHPAPFPLMPVVRVAEERPLPMAVAAISEEKDLDWMPTPEYPELAWMDPTPSRISMSVTVDPEYALSNGLPGIREEIHVTENGHSNGNGNGHGTLLEAEVPEFQILSAVPWQKPAGFENGNGHHVNGNGRGDLNTRLMRALATATSQES